MRLQEARAVLYSKILKDINRILKENTAYSRLERKYARL
jgi:hypothetical protein